jgi:hypothetical protein
MNVAVSEAPMGSSRVPTPFDLVSAKRHGAIDTKDSGVAGVTLGEISALTFRTAPTPKITMNSATINTTGRNFFELFMLPHLHLTQPQIQIRNVNNANMRPRSHRQICFAATYFCVPGAH